MSRSLHRPILKTFAAGLVFCSGCWVGAPSASAAANDAAKKCAPTFTQVDLAEGIAFLEAAFGQPLPPDEVQMAGIVFAKVDRNTDGTVCIKIAADSPGLVRPLPQLIDDLVPIL
jgi:hypothetical protein